jgi:argininosuccinate lyase
MILFSSQEFRFIHLPEAYSTGSSAMPKKKNPDLLELVRGKAARVIGNATTLIIVVKGLPLAYNKDLQETQEPLFEAAETMGSLVPLVTGWMKAVEFDHERMQQAAQSGFMNAWAAATYLVRRGVPFRLAHEQIGKVVQVCMNRGCELKDLPLNEFRSLNPVFDQDFYTCLTLDSVLAIHDLPGGTAPGQVRQAIAQAKQRIGSLCEEIHAHA